MRRVLIAGILLSGICVGEEKRSPNKPKFYRRRRYAEYLAEQSRWAQQASAFNTPIALSTAEPTATSDFAFVNENKHYRAVRRADWQGRKQMQRRQNSVAPQRTVTEFYGYNDGPLGTVTLLNTIGDEGDPTITVQSTTPWPFSFLEPTTTDLGPDTTEAFASAISTPNSQSPSGVAQFVTPYPYISDVSTTDYGGLTSSDAYTTRITPNPLTPTGTIRTVVGAPYITRNLQADDGAGQTPSTGIVVTSAANGNPSGTGTVDRITRASYQTATSFIDGRGTTSAAPASNTISAGTVLGQQGTVSVTAYYPYITSAVQIDNGPYAGRYTNARTVLATTVASRTGTVIVTTAAGYFTTTSYTDTTGSTIPLGQSIQVYVTSAGTVPGNSGTITITTPYPYVTLGSYTDLRNTASTTITESLATAGEPGTELKTGTISGILPDRYITLYSQSGSNIISYATTTAAEPGLHSPQSTGTINIVYPTGGSPVGRGVYGGCVADVNRNLLPYIGTVQAGTPDLCYGAYTACSTASYIALFGNRCYCGSLNPDVTLTAATAGCNTACPNYSPNTCGNGDTSSGFSNNALSLYAIRT